jgi:hypothetical protein
MLARLPSGVPSIPKTIAGRRILLGNSVLSLRASAKSEEVRTIKRALVEAS